MKYQLGDFVRFVDEKMEGFVTRIIDEQMIGVTNEDDFEIPVLVSKVTFVHGYEAKGSKAATTPAAAELPPTTTAFETKGIYLALTNDPKAGSVAYFYLLNTTSFQLLVALTTEQQQTYQGVFAGTVAPKSSVKIFSAPLADLQVWPTFILELITHTRQAVKPVGPIHFTHKFRGKDLSTAKQELPLLNERGWLLSLDPPELVLDAKKLNDSFR